MSLSVARRLLPAPCAIVLVVGLIIDSQNVSANVRLALLFLASAVFASGRERSADCALVLSAWSFPGLISSAATCGLVLLSESDLTIFVGVFPIIIADLALIVKFKASFEVVAFKVASAFFLGMCFLTKSRSDKLKSEAKKLKNFLSSELINSKAEISTTEALLSLEKESPGASQILKRASFDFPTNVEVFSRVGSGSSGEVLCCRVGNSLRALKKPLKNTLDNSSILKTFLREVLILAKVGPHRNVVRICGFSGKPDLALLLEYVEGGTLKERLSMDAQEDPNLLNFSINTSFSHDPIDSTKAMSDVVCGMSFLHSKRVAHRDLKAENMLVSSDGTIKIADFGCAKIVLNFNEDFEEKRRTVSRGSPLWMAPEVLRGESEIDLFSADVWSFGCLCAEICLSGLDPYAHEDSLSKFSYVDVAEGNANPFVAALMPSFLKPCFEFGPTKRPSANELSLDLLVFEREGLPVAPPQKKRVCQSVRIESSVLKENAFPQRPQSLALV